MLIQSINTDYKLVSFFGESLRRDGFITYLIFGLLALYLFTHFKALEIEKFYLFVTTISIVISGYGVIQYAGLDFINWTKSGGIISFFGNSNFAGAILAILFALNIGAIYVFRDSKKVIFSSISLALTLLATIFTNARQAYLIVAFALSVTIFYFLYRKKRIVGLWFFIFTIIVSTVSVFGIFGNGPLSKYLYKESITIRIFYWKAAIKMLMSHPLTGVGIDRYGAYFKEYRDYNYPLRYGFDITSSNAHNVPLQFFATGGFPLGIAYVGFVLFIFIKSFKFLKSSELESKFKFIYFNLFTAWLCFQLQSLVSIDNISVAIWGWLLSGILMALSTDKTLGQRYLNNKKNMLQPVISLLLVIPAIVISSMLAKVESQTFKLRTGYAPSNPETTQGWVNYASQTLKLPLLDGSYRTQIGGNLLDYKAKDLGIQALNESVKKDPRDQYAWWGLALASELNGDINAALTYRKKIEILDPWNAKNYLQMAYDYRAAGDLTSANRYAQKILTFASETEFGQKAKSEFSTTQ